MLIARRDGGPLARGLDHVSKPTEVEGTVTQLAFYAGWPKSNLAIGIVG